MKRKQRIVNISVLPGEPTDGTGRVCIHLFVPDERGPFVEPYALHPVFDEDGAQVKQKVQAKPTRGRLACDPRRNVVQTSSLHRGSSTTVVTTSVTMRTNDPRAITCPKCMASKSYIEAMTNYEQTGSLVSGATAPRE